MEAFMRAPTSILNFQAIPGTPVIAALLGSVAVRVGQLARAYRNRRNAALMATLDDRMLADVGLTRSDVRDAIAVPLWYDPPHLLRARVLERRLNRRGISLGLGADVIDSPSPPLVPRAEFARPRTDRAARFTL